MPRDKSKSDAGAVNTANWQTTIEERLRKGAVTLITSNRMNHELVLGGHEHLLKLYASRAGYPGQPNTLASVAQFKAITGAEIADVRALKEDYVNFIKNRLFDLAEIEGMSDITRAAVEEQFDDLAFSAFCQQLGYPRLTDATDPLLVLAGLPCKLYVTTSYYGFLEAALRAAGKEPRSDLCRWHKDLEAIPSIFDQDPSYIPSKERPLVYYLHGVCDHPDSLVITEDDHLQFLDMVAARFGSNTDPVHSRVRQEMNESLLLLGFSLSDWSFRSLFWGLIQKRSRKLLSAVTIQLAPNQIEQLYLEKYMDTFDFKVIWNDGLNFIQKLQQTIIG